ncbi:phytoene dehydrogenase [Tessaracoccus lapidicaptus]|uniref:Phytoene dehydrogenase n=1 Tax=Tessaracoccus lapidicaptus TaxID=1427523 RepID=A0A1C0AS14_9ACTN|nr:MULTISPECIES: phytoene desaturase family protein [Tessaracoccus]AQX16650.1 phytoene dehydrogenase [Tessaracoccus sp. T2.5-30]OCL37197.1 phytoene dehydrogenase [Tessaracoccus lapidicaptus]VEP41366.1 zeta-carotene-forming phytoene desaturase [Tessaracoccus lapidicaptus]
MRRPAPRATTPRTVAVVGAGLSGLAAALHLAGAGHRVTVLEREAIPGGRNGSLEKDGFRFDTGPTVFTMVSLLEEAFAAVGRRVSDYVTLQLLDPAYHAHFADGSTLLVRPGHEAMREEILAQSGAKDAAAFDRFVDWLKRLNDVELPHFIDANFNSPLSLFRSPRAALELVRLGGFGRLGPTVARRFDDERLHRVFSFQAMYAGLAPAQALALYAVITYMDSIEGVFFPEGGMHAVPRAMAAAATDAGVEIRYSSPVDRVERRGDGSASGVRLADGSLVPADAVVVTADLPVAYERLLPGLPAPRVARHGKYSPSALVWHVGVKGDLPQGVGHHNIYFGRAWDESFRELLDDGVAMTDPSRFLSVPSLDDPAAAPAGHHTLYYLEPVPNLHVGRMDWATEGPRLRERMLGTLDRLGYPTDIVTEELVTPVDWERQGMAAGTPFALAHTFPQTGPFRPRNVDRRVPGLVFAGSGTTPGVGIPMVLVSGKLAAARVAELGR